MSTDAEHDDPILDSLVDGSAYERVRIERFSHFKQPIPGKLAIQSVLLALVALLLPLYTLYPQSVSPYLPSLDPGAAAPKVLLLGVFGGFVQLGAAALLCWAALRRIRNAPLTEREAHALIDLEVFATYVGFATGGVAIVVTLGFFLLGLGGESALGWYVELTNGINPFRATGLPVSVTAVATAALCGSVLLVWARAYLATRLRRVGD